MIFVYFAKQRGTQQVSCITYNIPAPKWLYFCLNRRACRNDVLVANLKDKADFSSPLKLPAIFLFKQRGRQRVSIISRVILAGSWLFALITLIITAASSGSVITWLEFIYYFSYIKLGVTLIKYIPQVSILSLVYVFAGNVKVMIIISKGMV